MIEFLPCTDGEINKKLCSEVGVSCTPLVFTYSAAERGEQLGFAIFSISEKNMKVLYIPDDEYLADVLVRSGMNYAGLRGIKLVDFRNANNIDILQKLNFVKTDIIDNIEIADIINNCKNCGKS